MLDHLVVTIIDDNKVLIHKDDKFAIKDAEEDWLYNPYSHFMLLFDRTIENLNCVVLSLIYGKFINPADFSISEVPILCRIEENRIIYQKSIYNFKPAKIDNRIWLDFNKFDILTNLYMNDDHIRVKLLAIRNEIYLKFFSGLELLSYDISTGFRLVYISPEKYAALTNETLVKAGVINVSNRKNIMWNRCSSLDIRKILISLGSTGVGKSYATIKTVTKLNMLDPLNISWDDPLKIFRDTETLANVSIEKYKIGFYGVPHLIRTIECY